MIDRDEFRAAATVIEHQTEGFLPANAYVNLIDRVFLPASKADDELEQFLPVVVSVDADGAPCEFPDKTRKALVGAVAVFADRAVFGWMSGTFKLKYGSHTVRLADIDQVDTFSSDSGGTKVWSVDVVEKGATWSVLFAERLPQQIARGFARDLTSALRNDASTA